MTDDERQEWLTLLARMQKLLGNALNSLGGKPREGLHDGFCFYSAVQINRAAQGYLVLVNNGLGKTAPLLVRPAIEAMFRLQAVRANPSLVCRIAASERGEEIKMLESWASNDADNAIAILTKQWAQFEQLYRAKYPDQSFSDAKISTFELAQKADLEYMYNYQYRLYCKFTHAALRAAVGGFDEVTKGDAPLLTACAGTAVESLIEMGAEAVGYDQLKQEVSAFFTRFPLDNSEGTTAEP